MNSNLNKIRHSVIEHTLKLDNDQLALLLLIQLSRHQNLFIHEPSDWEDSPTGWITKDQRLQDEVIAILSFIILYSFTNAYHDENLFKEHRSEILAMHPEDFLNNSIYQSSFSQFIGKKTTRFIKLCDQFHIPILTFVDEPGFLIGQDAEKEATILYGTEAVLAAADSSVPWCSVLVRKSFGVAAAAHFGMDPYVLAWPSSEAGALPLEGGVAVAFGKEIAKAEDPEKMRKEIEEKLAKSQSPFPRAEAFSVHEIIDPKDTRKYLCLWIEKVQVSLKAKLMNLHK